MPPTATQYASLHGQRFVDELKQLLRIPSVSTSPAHVPDVRQAAQFCAEHLESIGLQNVRLIETSTIEQVIADAEGHASLRPGRFGHPLVYGDWLNREGAPTVLCYGHYDVQPAEPLEEWLSPPFEPTERNGSLYARGAVDDKGQMWMHVKALESLFATGDGSLPLNVRVLLEGEEEVGGEGIAQYLRENREDLKADVALISDTEMFAPELPTLCVGLRGMVYTEIEARGAKTDLHSGIYGGAAPNAFVALSQIITALKDREGRILIPGIYDQIEPPSDEELTAWKQLPFDEAEYREHEVGSIALAGEKSYSVLERLWARPSLDVHGMPGGFIGAGAKTVIPARAVAKVSLRLVPGMTPTDTFDKLQQYVQAIAPDDVIVETRLLHSGDPIVINTGNPFVRAATDAMQDVWRKETVFVRGGGSIPIVGDFVRVLGMPAILMGFGLPDDNLHAPNEKFHLGNFHRGIASIIRFLERLSTQPSTARRETTDL